MTSHGKKVYFNRTGRSRCEHIPWWWVNAGEMGGLLLLGLPAPVTPASFFLPWWRYKSMNEWMNTKMTIWATTVRWFLILKNIYLLYNKSLLSSPELRLVTSSLYLSLCFLEEAASGFHPEGSTGHPPVEIMAVRVHLLQVGYCCLLHAG